MTILELVAIAHVAATLVVGAGQIGIVWYGIRAMNRASDERAKDRRQAAQVADQHHAEAMRRLDIQARGLETLIARTAPAAD